MMHKTERKFLHDALSDLDDTTKGILFYMGFTDVDELIEHLLTKVK